MRFLGVMGQLLAVLIIVSLGLSVGAVALESLPPYWALPVYLLMVFLTWLGVHSITERK